MDKFRPMELQQEKGDGRDWARRILARVEAGDKSVRLYAHKSARQALGLEGRMRGLGHVDGLPGATP